ncbi:galactokinase [Nocardiopsis sp. TSRI0078]|uniref:galactokinase n=1 Tax=unclassified Nocardiopsis TaxID=2649073 RepID=UPI00093CA95C|nr:galactokinase [Nocardiopsis sp. TSRI0078]OKI23513.1 galactokinase [Nocardiopsis sp. TSRI0078]
MDDATTVFHSAFGHGPEGVWAAPGRINLIGEHTDYNDGFVLPFALPHALTAAAARRADGTVRFRSRQSGDGFGARLPDLLPGAVEGWASYPAGALWVLRDEGYTVDGMDLLVDSTIPTGAGLSSSAALTCATVMAAASLHGAVLEPAEVARLAQRVENDFVGMPCGILDQSASMLSTEGHALFMDTRSMVTEQVPFDPAAAGLTVLVVDTRAPHRLVEGHYADRRRSCEEAARLLGVAALRDVADLPGALAALPDDVSRRRVRHVVTENARVLKTVDLLRSGDLRSVGPLLTASHASLRDDYEVSVPEVDTAVDALLAAGALGARITGGGFGGCVVALSDTDRVEACGKAVREAYRERGFTRPAVFGALPSAGARRLYP